MHTIWLIIEFAFWLIVIASFLHTLLTHFILWYELRLSALLKGQSAEIPWFILTKSFLIEFVCVFLNCIVFPIGFSKHAFNRSIPHSLETSNPLASNLPVLLVHGYLHNQSAWLWFIHALQKQAGIGAIFSLNLNPPCASIVEFAEILKNKIHAIQTETGAEQIILIGHSMGGLVSSYYCEYLAPPGEINKIITLGTPFQGTRTGVLGVGKEIIEMAPESSFLSDLNERIQQSKVPYYTIASKIDNMIVPWEAALLPEGEAKEQLVLEDYGHMRLLISNIVVEQVSTWIRS